MFLFSILFNLLRLSLERRSKFRKVLRKFRRGVIFIYLFENAFSFVDSNFGPPRRGGRGEERVFLVVLASANFLIPLQGKMELRFPPEQGLPRLPIVDNELL